jgi:lysozyme family protein
VSPAFEAALEFTLHPEIEGGLSDHPRDRGGRTNHGITQKTYDAYRTSTGQERRLVDLIEEREMRAIYHDDYWVPCNCDALAPALAAAVFDMAVNSGVWNAKIALQRAVHVRADGVVGPVTVAASKATPDVILRFLEKRMAYIQDVLFARPSQVEFLEGWGIRLLRQAWNGAKA